MSTSDLDIVFHRYFSRLPKYLGDLYRGRLDMSKFEIPELAGAFESARDEINARWRAHVTRIQAPHGKVSLHLDYIDSTDTNAITFSSEGIYFVGITDKMLVHISKACEAIWRLNVLAELLEIDLDEKTRNFLFQAVLLIQLQFISSHELGHLFHGHVDRSAFNEEFAQVDQPAQDSDRLKNQAREVEADGYAVHMLFDNLITGDSGRFTHGRLRSALSVEDCALTLFILSIGVLFFFLRPREFDSAEARTEDHPFALVRMNVVLYDLIGWCTLNRPDLVEWASLDRFQRIMACAAQAAQSHQQQLAWARQGEFLKSSEGKQYLSDLYSERESLRAEMTGQRWELIPISLEM